MNPSDAALVSAVRERGDESAYAELYRRHAAAAYGAAYRVAPNLDHDDIVSESFTRILQAIRNGGGPTELFRPYLYQTVRNATIDLAGAAGREVDLDEQRERADPASLHDMADALSDRDAVSSALSLLPERWRAVIWYTEVEGMKPAAVALLMGTSANNIAQIRRRARKRLRTLIDQGVRVPVRRRDLVLGRKIAVVTLGAGLAGAMRPVFEGTAAAAAVGAGAGAVAIGALAHSKALIGGVGILILGAAVGTLLLLAPVEQESSPQPSPKPTPEESAPPTVPPPVDAEPEPEQPSPAPAEPDRPAPAPDAPAAEPSAPEPVQEPSGSGGWEEVPLSPPVVRGPHTPLDEEAP